MVFIVLEETEMGPIFSSREKAEAYLDDGYEEDWRATEKVQGYPHIEEVALDDTEFILDR